MMPQFARSSSYRFSSRNLAVGLSVFAIGLAKKVLIADNLAPHAAFFFDQGDIFSLVVAWGGVLAYAFQLYFDFSGYSDMAIGISLLFGIRLPLNFDSPYKSVNIIEFWRRWHMTLSRFLRDYLYVPLGGNRKGPIRRYVNLMLTMLLGGLWHGAGVNFVIWGALHGLYLVVNHGWNALATALRFPRTSRIWAVFSIALTFVSVCFAWVFFRATTIGKASIILQGMTGQFGIGLPASIGVQLRGLKPLLEQWGVTFYLGGGSRFLETWEWVVVAAVIAFIFPNTQQIMGHYDTALGSATRSHRATWQLWQPSRRWAMYIGVILLGSLLSLSRPAEFLYFQF
jgi:D-alanyl-lipoteichoic acid acyltransferase DltB (MBOAT superfamily)